MTSGRTRANAAGRPLPAPFSLPRRCFLRGFGFAKRATVLRVGIAGSVALYFVNPEAHAQPYPSRPVQIVVPLAAGGAADTIARATARRLSEMWNQQVIVENKSGANTQIGATQVSKSAPDGHTLLVSAETTFVVNPYLYSKLSYDPGKDFVTVSGLAIVNQLLLVHPSVPAQNVQDLIALAKEK